MKNKGLLYIVSTPIGNLEDITLRALRILGEVSLIAAEDTRRTRKLLSAYDITCPLTSLYNQNEPQKSSYIITRILEGDSVAYVSDAGTPGISDPGYVLINQAIAHDIPVVPIPGPSAAVAALSASGLPMDSFVFFGFLPSRKGKRMRLLQSLEYESKTMVFYESPRRLLSTLQEMKEHFGNRSIAVARELTKIHEEIIRGTIGELITSSMQRKIKGEVTIVVSGSGDSLPAADHTLIEDRVTQLQKERNISTRDMIDIISKESGMSRKDVYHIVLSHLREK